VSDANLGPLRSFANEARGFPVGSSRRHPRSGPAHILGVPHLRWRAGQGQMVSGVPNVSISDDKTPRTSGDCSITASLRSGQPGVAQPWRHPAASHRCRKRVLPCALGDQQPLRPGLVHRVSA
jgi:hypothetical protein